MAQKRLTLYIDYASQPARTLVDFCQRNEIPHEVKQVLIYKGQHMSEEYEKINPMKQIPAIQEIDEDGKSFTLSESSAILKYLADSRGVPDHWYPKDLHKRALVNQYFDWHHNFLRQGSGGLIFRMLFAKKVLGMTFTPEQLKYQEMYLKRSLVMMERWLSKTKFICSDEISIADLLAAHELDQCAFIDYDLSKYPKVKDWLKRVIDDNPTSLKLATIMRKMAAMSLKKNGKPKL